MVTPQVHCHHSETNDTAVFTKNMFVFFYCVLFDRHSKNNLTLYLIFVMECVVWRFLNQMTQKCI